MPRTQNRDHANDASPRPGRGEKNGGPNITEEDILEAKRYLAEAFQIAGLFADGYPVCPACGTAKRGKVRLKNANDTGLPYWKCFKCSTRGDAIGVLKDVKGYSFVDAVNTLIGRDETGVRRKVARPEIQIQSAFVATVDVEVYNAIRDAGSLSEAQRYYARWHIAAEAVAEAGSRYITNATELQQQLLGRFGRDRLLACGVLTVDKNGKDFFLFNDDYPVIEVHASPAGHVVGMQFRPSVARMAKVQAHKAWKRRWSNMVDEDGNILDPGDAWLRAYSADPEAAGPKLPYVTPFLSLRGAGTDSLVGCGIPRIASLPVDAVTPVKVYVVEGFKDLLAARTMGVEAYAIPGTGVMPPEKVCKILARHKMVVTLDGDDAGAKGRANVMAWFSAHNVPSEEISELRPGMDIADILVERHAHAGCGCENCTQWRDTHPWDPTTCPCSSCRKRRN